MSSFSGQEALPSHDTFETYPEFQFLLQSNRFLLAWCYCPIYFQLLLWLLSVCAPVLYSVNMWILNCLYLLFYCFGVTLTYRLLELQCQYGTQGNVTPGYACTHRTRLLYRFQPSKCTSEMSTLHSHGVNIQELN